jgi:hypothetical protein
LKLTCKPNVLHVLKVHDRDDVLNDTKEILHGVAGFAEVTVVQDDALRGTDLYNVYCTRGRDSASL